MRRLHIILYLFLLLSTGSILSYGQSAGKSNKKSEIYFSDPSISPDGSEIAFVSGGDVWTVPSAGGKARLLIARPGYDSRPLYSPDGQYIAFSSTITGNGDIYTYNLKSGELNRLTYDDANDEINGWSADSKLIYFASQSHDIGSMKDVYKIKVSGGTPMPVTDNRFITEFFAAPSPDGKSVAFNMRGMSSIQWWRNGRSHLDESEIWIRQTSGGNAYTPVTKRGARDLWPMWSKDGAGMYFISDRTGTQNLWYTSIKGEPKQLTKFSSGRMIWPSLSANGASIVFEKDFKIWKYNLSDGKAAEVPVSLMGAATVSGTEHLRLTTQFREVNLSPDGKKIAFVARGEVFVAGSKEGGDAFRVTNTTQRESQPIWTANSNGLIYISERDGQQNLYQYNFITNTETRLTSDKKDDVSPVLSPDGKLLAFIRDNKELHVLDLASKKDLIIAKAVLGRAPFSVSGTISWSPDNKWIAFGSVGDKALSNVHVASVTGSPQSRPISFLGNSFGGDVVWSPGGKYVLFATAQRTEKSFIARVDLVPGIPFFKEEQFQKLFVEQNTSPSSPMNPGTPGPKTDSAKSAKTDTAKANAPKKKSDSSIVKIDYDGIMQRTNFLPLGADIGDFTVSKDGKLMVLTAAVGDQVNIYTYSLDESSREPAVLKQLTTSPGNKSNIQISSDGREVLYMEQGRVMIASIDSKQSRPVSITAEMDIDFATEKLVVFNEAWESQNKGFYDPAFHGTDWKKVHDTYEPYVQGSANPDELRRLLNLMVGELNASHSGVSGPPAGGGFATAKTGLLFDTKEYDESGRFKISEVIFLGPAYLPETIKVGDYLLAIDENKLSAGDNIDRLMQNKIGKKVVLTVSSSANGAAPRKVSISPVSIATEKGLLYKQWVMQQRKYVDRISNGRLGYVHMADMTEPSLYQLYFDIDADNHAREGVVIDVRNNNGGFVNPYAIDVFARKNYLTMTGRGMPSAPGRTQLGQRSLDAPTILVTNQHSLSDAEDFTEGYRTLKLGKVVGEPTSGWIVFTSSFQLIDGSAIRMPFSKITDHEGENMELVPRAVDIPVSRMPGEGTEKDSQLDAAVKELLNQIGKKN